MAQKYFRYSARMLAVICFLLSFGSLDLKYVAMISAVIAFCLYFLERSEELEYDRERNYRVFSFNEEAAVSLCNFGWTGLVFLTSLLVFKFLF